MTVRGSMEEVSTHEDEFELAIVVVLGAAIESSVRFLLSSCFV